MIPEHHQLVAKFAESNGFMTQAAFNEVLSFDGEWGANWNFWVERGWLNYPQLAEIMDLIKADSKSTDFFLENANSHPLEPAETAMFERDVLTSALGVFADESDVEWIESTSESTEFFEDRPEPTRLKSERYILGDMLGAGGGGRVVRAYDSELGRTVAMKILNARTTGTDVKRFVLEAKTTGELEHPSIVPIYDVGKLASGEWYYTMREVRRHSLRDVLNALRQGDPPYTEEYTLVRLVTLLLRVCEAVAYAHSRGVVHRDIKPDNIMIGSFGEVLVMDWGLARRDDIGELKRSSGAHTFGTPAYMPPEQAKGDLELIDERSDVYAIGAVLYELLTLEPPYVGESPVEIMWNVVDQPLIRPSKRRPEKTIPEELERICITATQKDIGLRYESVADLIDDIERWLEGIQESEANKKVEEGRRAFRLYDELNQRVASLTNQVKRYAMTLQGWEPVDQKREFWALEDEREAAEVERVRAFGESVSHYTQALAFQHDNLEANNGLAELYWKRRNLSRKNKNVADMVYFEALVRQYDDGRYAALLDSLASAQIASTPENAKIEFSATPAVDRIRSVIEFETLGETPLLIDDLEAGSYSARFSGDGLATVVVPIAVERGQFIDVSIEIPKADEVAEGFVFVASGEYASGGDPNAFDPRPERGVHVDGFFCSTLPVTFRSYLEMINELYTIDEEAALNLAPQTRGAEGLLCRQDKETGLWIPHEILIEGPAREMYPIGEGFEWDLPVVGVSYADAIAFCEWQSAKDGRKYRLPTEHEFEKAGRGVDSRYFSWGDKFDPTFCKMRFSRQGLPQLEPVGTFAADISPYGVMDLCGGVEEWCMRSNDTTKMESPVRGGAWNQDARTSRLASRIEILELVRTASIGFRLVYSQY